MGDQGLKKPDPEPCSPGAPFSVMAKPAGPACNLDCAYCFYLDKKELFPDGRPWRMPSATLESYIRQVVEARDGRKATFVWQGGEPTLLGVSFFEEVVELQKKYGGPEGIDNALQTNGILLDEEWCSFLAQHRFLVGVSIDGPREIHNRYRLNKMGQGSFDRVLHGVELLKNYGVEFNTLTVVHRGNAMYPLEIYGFLKDIGSRFLQFIPVVERVSGPPGPANRSSDPTTIVADWSVNPVDYGAFLCAVFDQWVRHDVGSVFVQAFDVALESWMGMQPNLCVFRTTCGDALVLEHNGDLFSCDHFVDTDHRLGNLADVSLRTAASLERQVAFGRAKRESLPGQCLECSVRFACNGECPKHRFVATPEGEGGLNYLCPAYNQFFRYIDVPMRYMAEEIRNRRSPANVMQWIGRWDGNAHRRNEPCFCGSGKKFKQCHGL